MKAKSIKEKSLDEIQSNLESCMKGGLKPTQDIVFLSIVQNRSAICQVLDKEGIAIFGATTSGEFIDEDLNKESTAVLLLDIHPDYFSLFFEEYPTKNYREATQGIAKEAKMKFSNPSLPQSQQKKGLVWDYL